MARRRKKSKAAAAQAKVKEKEMLVDKSLPALPPNAAPQSAFTTDRNTPDSGETDTHTELSPRPRPQYANNDSSRSSSRRVPSPERSTGDMGYKDGLILPTTTYRNHRHSTISQASDMGHDGEGFFIPLALDPNPAPALTPRSTSNNTIRTDSNKSLKELASSGKDYFSPPRSTGRGQSKSSHNDTPSSQGSTPHIAFQEKDRTASSEHVEPTRDSSRRPPPHPASKSTSATASPAIGSEEPKRHLANCMNNGNANDKSSADKFHLQDVPKRKRSNGSKSSPKPDMTGENSSPQLKSGAGDQVQSRRDISSSLSRSGSSDSYGFPQDRSGASQPYLSTEKAGTPRSSQESRPSTDSVASSIHPTREAPIRNDTQNSLKSITRKEIGGGNIVNTSVSSYGPDSMISSTSSTETSTTTPTVNGRSISSPVLQSSAINDDASSAKRTLARPPLPQQKLSDTYMAPRAPPMPPSHKAGKASVGSITGEPASPLPRWSAGGDFTMDEDMARILGTDEGSQSILRRVSNAVRHGRSGSEISNSGRYSHGRSVSETTNRAGASPHWSKSTIAEDETGHTCGISSPISVSSPRGDDPALLRRQLRNSEQRVAELERQFITSTDLKSMNKQLVEKRKTVSELGSQAELMIRQIEILAGYVEKAKSSKAPLDLQEMEDSAIKEFVQKLERLKQAMSREVEALFEERETLLEEKDQATKARDRALIEFEQLSSKNAQLADLNNDLTTQIQERFKAQSNANIDSSKPVNGLGIYTNHSKDKGSIHLLDDASITSGSATVYGSSLATVSSYPQMMDQDPAMEPATVLAAPHVVNIRKGQVKKFNWKKGGGMVAKGVTKGFKGAFSSERNEKNQWQGQQGDSIGMPYNTTVTAVESPGQMNANNQPRSTSNDPRGFGLFKKNHNMPKGQSIGNLSAIVAENPSTLFGSDLVERAEFERRQIPSVVIRCIEEVELRGMEVEGIYRKTGGSGLVKTIQEGFEKSEDYDISDPDLDITAVTSVLKQYFRKLPIPLLTFDIYDRVLESLSKYHIFILVPERC